MNLIGLDLSLTSTGIVIYQAHVGYVALATTVETEPSRTAEEEMKRLLRINDEIFTHISKLFVKGHTLAAIEAPSYGSIGGHAATRHGLNYMVRDTLYGAGIPFLVVAPMTLKKWVIKGNAKKEEMKLATYKRWGFEAKGNDIIDAYCLCRLAEAWIGKDESLKKIECVGVDRLAI